MARRKRKAINFDLDTTRMRDIGLYPNGYYFLQKSFEKVGFSHRQGSGYISKEFLTESDVYLIVEGIVKEQSWLTECVKKIDVTDIGRQHDLTEVVKALGNEAFEQSDKPISEEKENTKEKLTPKDKEIIERIKKSKSGDVFSELYDGRYEGNKTVADERIMNILAFFTDCNEEQMLRIYKSSGLNVWGTEEKSVKYMARATVATYTNKSVSPTNRRTEYKGK